MASLSDHLYDLRIMATDAPLFRRELTIPAPWGRISQAGELFKTDPGSEMTAFRTFGRYAIVYVTGGGGMYADASGQSRTIRAGDLILVFPSLPHRYGPQAGQGQTWEEIYLVFDGELFEAWETSGLLSPTRPVLRLTPVATWRRRLISVLCVTPPRTQADVLGEACRLQQFLADALAAQDPSPHGTDAAWLDRARAMLDRHADAHAAAAAMHCSYAAFRRRFTRLAGTPPARYLAHRRIERACELMHRGVLADKQIAAELGFCDEFHFSRRFKQITGLSPRAYRRSLP